VDRRVGEELDERFQHVLRAAKLVEPVVDQDRIHVFSHFR
jgi:hypothetical protein